MKLGAWLISLFIVLVPISAEAADRSAQTQPALRISVLASGKILINGKESSLGEPTSQAMEVVKLIIANKLPISFSSKLDFSDYIDEKGRSQPRK